MMHSLVLPYFIRTYRMPPVAVLPETVSLLRPVSSLPAYQSQQRLLQRGSVFWLLPIFRIIREAGTSCALVQALVQVEVMNLPPSLQRAVDFFNEVIHHTSVGGVAHK